MYALNGLHQDSGHGCGRWSSKRFASTHLQSIITLYTRHEGCSVKQFPAQDQERRSWEFFLSHALVLARQRLITSLWDWVPGIARSQFIARTVSSLYDDKL